MNVLFIDNLDSFTYNLVEEFAVRGCDVRVVRNHHPVETLLPEIKPVQTRASNPEDIRGNRVRGSDFEPGNEFHPDLIVLSPGPGRPEQAGSCIELVRRAHRGIPIFGICLGHQALAAALGGSVSHAPELLHGKASPVRHDGKGLYRGMENPFQAGRYHSLAVTKLPPGFIADAYAGETVMGMRHRTLPLYGVQFHPESILTPAGGILIDNLMEAVGQPVRPFGAKRVLKRSDANAV